MSGLFFQRILISSPLIQQYKTIYQRCFSLSVNRLNIKDNILYNPYKATIPKLSISEYIYSKIESYCDLTAFECPITHRKFTYGELRKTSRNLSKAFRKKFGLSKGDVVLIYLVNCPEFPVACLGCFEAGLVASTVNSLYTSEEVLRQLKDSSAKLIITSYDLHENAAKAVSQLPTKLPIICVKTKAGQLLPRGAIDFTEIINSTIDIPDLELPSPDDLAILPYSSGTTGLPKGVRLSHSNIVSNMVQTDEPNSMLQSANANFQEISPGVLPMFHIYGFTITTLNLMLKGAKALTLPRFHPDTFIDCLRQYAISVIFAAPPLILFMTHSPEIKKEYFKHLRTVLSGAAPLGAKDEEQFRNKAGEQVAILQGYGLTETSPVISMCKREIQEKFGDATKGSIGLVVPNTEIKIVEVGSNNGIALGPNEQGELLVKGPQVMQGYHNNEEATKSTFLDGWFRTGDMAYYDQNELIFITDRVKELIKVKGFQVAPAELEELLRQHPHIADAAVIGIPDEISGEIPRAYVKIKEKLNPEDVYNFVAQKVAKYKRLDGGIEVVEELPKNSAGKILRRQLKQRYLDEN
ncbi:hypothetical protein ABEB36_005095 [Hypothenemus hampei]|uniref:Luciferin 4-monooxygenase n=1 Tax=Hypothenemus hampei TaxID=57062 RepID=A0ABD1EWY5_HYPHA